MKQPCRNCPFRSDRIFLLGEERRLEIAHSIFKDADFPCHKTFGEMEEYHENPWKAKRCTGAAIFLEHARSGGLLRNLAFRFAVMWKEIDIEKLDMSFPVAKTYEEFVNLESRN